MSRLVVNENLTLDGVMQSPSDPDEDRCDGVRARRLLDSPGGSEAGNLEDSATPAEPL